MVSAQKHQMPGEPRAENPSPSPVTGFAKVLNSVHGLQQRLGDFSVEDVSRAQIQTHEFLGKMSALQDRLIGLMKLKSRLKEVDARLIARPVESFDSVDPASLENHPQLRAIIDAGKLIRMHRALRAAQASAESVSLRASPQPPVEPHAPVSTSPVVLLERIPAAETAASKQEPAGIRSSDGEHGLADTKVDDVAKQPTAAKPSANEPSATREKRAQSPAPESRFNERLLADLIQTYGELAPDKSSERAAANGGPELPLASREPPRSTDLVPAKSLVPAPPPAQAKDSLPSGAHTVSESPKGDHAQSVGNSKSQDEIDRQLKNIIRDYGEYDLYSQEPSSKKIKTAALAAAAALGLLIGGFYLLKTPSVAPPAAVEQPVSGGQSTSVAKP